MNAPAVLVLRDNVSRDRMEALAAELGWRSIADVVRGHFVLASRRWYDAQGTIVEYLEDHTADVRWVNLDGVGQDEIATTIRDALPCFTVDELFTEIEESEDPIVWIRDLGRLSVLRPRNADPRFVALWNRALSHPVRAVRRAAIRTAYGCDWPDLAALVRARLEEETELRRPLDHLRAYLERDD
jgi:hypothetical protein